MIEALVDLKMWAVATTGLGKDALHIHVSLLVLLGSALLLRRPLSAALPWLATLFVALAGEALDYLARGPGASWMDAAMHDLLNTMLWPTVLVALARFSRLRFR